MPGDEVEEAPPVVGDQPAALAVHERDREARVRRKQRRAGERRSSPSLGSGVGGPTLARSGLRSDLGAADERRDARARAPP